MGFKGRGLIRVCCWTDMLVNRPSAQHFKPHPRGHSQRRIRSTTSVCVWADSIVQMLLALATAGNPWIFIRDMSPKRPHISQLFLSFFKRFRPQEAYSGGKLACPFFSEPLLIANQPTSGVVAHGHNSTKYTRNSITMQISPLAPFDKLFLSVSSYTFLCFMCSRHIEHSTINKSTANKNIRFGSLCYHLSALLVKWNDITVEKPIEQELEPQHNVCTQQYLPDIKQP